MQLPGTPLSSTSCIQSRRSRCLRPPAELRACAQVVASSSLASHRKGAAEAAMDKASAMIGEWQDEMVVWRRKIHAYPELAFEEERTSDMVARMLGEWGYAVDRSLGGTGVVGTLSANINTDNTDGLNPMDDVPPAIMLRADMDALPVSEENEFSHCSQRPGIMHACGHDGHTAMLLGAARQLAEKRNFRGTVHLVFQPAEEGTPTSNRFGLHGGGALAMLEDGLLAKYPVRAAFGMHNWPGLPAGRIAVHSGPVMAGVDNFTIQVEGVGCHAAMPHLGAGSDPVLASAAIVVALQSLVSRVLDPLDSAVVSATQLHAGDAFNVIPPTAVIRGTLRSFKSAVRDSLMAALKRTAESVAEGYRCHASVSFSDFFPATVNSAAEASEAAAAAVAVVGAEHVDFDTRPPSMGAEDFGYILQRVAGCYVWLGNGPTEGGCMLHNPKYDFNDDVLPVGAAYWVQLVTYALPVHEGAN